MGVDVALREDGLKKVYDAVRGRQTRKVAEERRISSERLCHAMELACVFYPRTVLCLQRSVAAVFLLRRFGWPAQLVTGCGIATFENHAWAELAGEVLNDRPYMNEMYQVLDRC
jgi:hypothetical protein